MTKPDLDDRDLATILAALRLYQKSEMFEAAKRPFDINDVATDGGTVEALSDDEIDDLCERLNLGEIE